MKTLLRSLFHALLIAGFILPMACKKRDKTDDDPSLRLAFSADTVFFDTVFTTIGSVTQRLVVYNPNDHNVNVSKIWLSGGTNSLYRINIDGDSSLAVNDIEIPRNDSLFIFIRITVDPTSQSLPFLVSDSILFTVNGNLQQVQLAAWGQNAHFLKAASVKGIQVWDSLLPYVIYSYVRIDTSASLLIMPGTKVYFHKNAYMTVSHDATLQVLGNREHRVRFQGDRLDPFYRDLTGQWRGLYFERGSKEHDIQYAVIKNSIYGLLVDELATAGSTMLNFHNSIIQNTTSDAIFAYGSSIVSTNCVISNCGGSALWVEKGGSYDFRQLTIGNFWSNSVRFSPSIFIRNYAYDTNGIQVPGALTSTLFGNTIIWGTELDEITLDEMAGIPFEITFDHALLKTTAPLTDPQRYLSCIANEDPLFVNPQTYDLKLDTLSPAIGKGVDMGVPFDIDGHDRGSIPDLGAYQWVPTR